MSDAQKQLRLRLLLTGLLPAWMILGLHIGIGLAWLLLEWASK